MRELTTALQLFTCPVACDFAGLQSEGATAKQRVHKIIPYSDDNIIICTNFPLYGSTSSMQYYKQGLYNFPALLPVPTLLFAQRSDGA